MDTVKRAAALLDRAKPGWENLIDTETLTLDGPTCETDCILGQVYGGFYHGVELFFTLAAAQGVRFENDEDPFNEDLDSDENTYQWLAEIHDRRAMHNNPAQLQIDFKKVAA